MTLQDRQARRHAYAERGDDLYETPCQATVALLRAEKLPRVIWEPAAGHNAIVDVLRKAGHFVIASDLIDYGYDEYVWDFLDQYMAPTGTEAIITNPPFREAEAFVKRALDLCPRVVMLLRLAFLESERRTSLLENAGLARVHVFRNRLPMMHRAGWKGPKASSSVAFAWFVWDRRHKGPTTISRISWER
jgi:hypothetical protein